MNESIEFTIFCLNCVSTKKELKHYFIFPLTEVSEYTGRWLSVQELYEAYLDQKKYSQVFRIYLKTINSL